MEKNKWLKSEAKDYLDKGANKKRFVHHESLKDPLFRVDRRYYFNLVNPRSTVDLTSSDCGDLFFGWYPCDKNGNEILEEDLFSLLLVLDGLVYSKDGSRKISKVVLSKWVMSHDVNEYEGEAYDQKEGEKLLVVKGYIYIADKSEKIEDTVLKKWKIYNPLTPQA